MYCCTFLVVHHASEYVVLVKCWCLQCDAALRLNLIPLSRLLTKDRETERERGGKEEKVRHERECIHVYLLYIS